MLLKLLWSKKEEKRMRRGAFLVVNVTIYFFLLGKKFEGFREARDFCSQKYSQDVQ